MARLPSAMPILAVTTERSVAAGDLERGGQHVEDPLRHHFGSGGQRGTLGQHHELVTPEAPDGVLLADGTCQPRRHRSQQLVARRVAQGVVDVLEVVEVQEENGHGGVLSSGPGQHLVDPVEDQGPIGELGERVVEGQMVELAGCARRQAPGPESGWCPARRSRLPATG